jgi:ankyrin repeat protein
MPLEKGETVLHAACLRNDEASVKATLTEGLADLQARTDSSRQSALHYAAKKGFTSICTLLLNEEEGSCCKMSWCQIWSSRRSSLLEFEDSCGKTALHYAAEGGFHATCKVLLEKGASCHVTDLQGKTPLHFAAGLGHLTICHLLVSCGARVDLPDHNEQTPFHYALDRGAVDVCKAFFINKTYGLRCDTERGGHEGCQKRSW